MLLLRPSNMGRVNWGRLGWRIPMRRILMSVVIRVR